MNTMRDAITTALQRRADYTDRAEAERRARSARTPDTNNPLLPVYERPRRGGPTYRDKTANDAISNVDRERKKASKR